MSVSPDRARVAPSRPRITECSQVSSARTFTRAVNEPSQVFNSAQQSLLLKHLIALPHLKIYYDQQMFKHSK